MCGKKRKDMFYVKCSKKFCLFSNLCAALVCHELLNELPKKKHYVSYHQFAEFVIAHIPSFHIPIVISLKEKKIYGCQGKFYFLFFSTKFFNCHFGCLPRHQVYKKKKYVCFFHLFVTYFFYINISLYLFAY